MNINRHNYESYLLLYVDNELSAAEKSTVDVFLAENPDLAIELELLAQTKLSPEITSHGNLSALLKEEPIQPAMLDQMMLKLDGELPASEASRVLSEIQTNPTAKKEWEILQKTKLDPAETIRFPYTEGLYRHSGSRVVAMRFFRYAAAAAILGFGLFTGYRALYPANNAHETEIAAGTNGKAKTKIPGNGNTADASQTPTEATGNLASVPEQATGPEKAGQPAIAGPVPHKEQTFAASNNITDKPTRNITQPAVNKQPEKENRRDIVSENINKLPRNISSPESVELEKRTLNEKNEAMLIANNNKEVPQKEIKPLTALDTDIMQPLPVAGARTASISNEPPGTEENDVLFLDDEQVKKSKLNGLIRKIKRNVERRTNIKTGNGIKIAGFEIAAR